MEIKIDSLAQEYMEKNKIKELHMQAYIPKVCCGKANINPMINVGKPAKNKDNYEEKEVNNFKIYVEKPILKMGEDFEITYEKYLFTGALALSKEIKPF